MAALVCDFDDSQKRRVHFGMFPLGNLFLTQACKCQVPNGEHMSQRFRNILGPNVRKWRKKAGLSQDDLAARLQLAGLENIDRVAVAKIESQIRSLFDYELVVIGTVLKVSPEEMLAVSDRSLRANLPSLCGARLRD